MCKYLLEPQLALLGKIYPEAVCYEHIQKPASFADESLSPSVQAASPNRTLHVGSTMCIDHVEISQHHVSHGSRLLAGQVLKDCLGPSQRPAEESQTQRDEVPCGKTL